MEMPTIPSPAKPYNKVVFLESIRGLAALVIVFHHLLLSFISPILTKDGGGFSKSVSYAIQLLIDGQLSVYVFFVLSGFVLSLSFFRTRNRDVVSSSAIRRFFRLFIPVFVSVMLSWLILHTGCAWNSEAAELMPLKYRTPDSNWLGEFLPQGVSFLDALKQGLGGTFFNFDLHRSLNSNLWTMPIELNGSFLTFAVLALFGSLPRRGLIYAMLAFLCSGYYLEFICGIALCDIYTSCEKRSKPIQFRTGTALLLVTASFLVGGGMFRWLAHHAGIQWLAYFPNTWGTLSGAVIITAVLFSPALQRILESKPFVFLGKVSFALYVVHMLVIVSLGSWFYIVLRHASLGHAASAICAALLTIAASLLVAWGLYYIADLQSIRLGKAVERFFLQKTNSKSTPTKASAHS